MVTVDLEPMRAVREALGQFSNFLEGVEREQPTLAGLNFYAQWLDECFRAIGEHKPIVAHQFSFFPELIYAFDLHPLCAEAWSILPLYMDPLGGTEAVDVAENAGVHPELCGSFKFNIGEMIRGRMPMPHLMICPSAPCDSARISYQIFQHYTNAPMFYLDEGYWDTEEDLDYIEGEYRRLIAYMEQLFNRKLNYDRLAEVLEENNKAIGYFLEASELRKLVPCPQSGKALLYSSFGFMAAAGHPLNTALQKAILDDAKERAEKGIGIIPEEKIRCVWFYATVIWDYTLFNWLEDEWKLVIPITLDSYHLAQPIDTSSPDTMIRGLAERTWNIVPMGRQGRGPADVWIDDMLNAYDNWKGNCIILSGHVACKWLKLACGLVRETCRELGIPLFMFDVDLFDPRVVSAETYRQKIADFITTVVLPAVG